MQRRRQQPVEQCHRVVCGGGIGTLGRSTQAELTDTGMPEQAAAQATEVVTSSAGAVIPTLQANPATAAAGDAAATGMIHASKVTTGVAAAIITLGLAATWALPPTPPPPHPPSPTPPRQEPAVRPGRRRTH